VRASLRQRIHTIGAPLPGSAATRSAPPTSNALQKRTKRPEHPSANPHATLTTQSTPKRAIDEFLSFSQDGFNQDRFSQHGLSEDGTSDVQPR
jgi:hypothetical protein